MNQVFINNLMKLDIKEFSVSSMVFKSNTNGIYNKLTNWIEANKYYKIVIKDPKGTTGKSIFFASYKGSNYFEIEENIITVKELFNRYSANGILYIEPYLSQHESLKKIAPYGLNTLRIITILNTDKSVDIIAAVLRLSLDKRIDNFSAGNLAAAIDISTGIVISPAKAKTLAVDNTSYFNHPITNEKIIGFKIPYWKEIIKKVKQAATIIPEVRTVGWDIAILQDKIVIIEGNPKWNKDTPQIPLNKGIKPILTKYL